MPRTIDWEQVVEDFIDYVVPTESWKIQDWTGRRTTLSSFASFEKGWEYVRIHYPQDQWEDIYVVQEET